MEKSDLLYQGRFTPAQLELLKFFATNPSEKEVDTVRQFFVEYYAERALDAVDRAIEERQYTDEEVDSWSRKHSRTLYSGYHNFLEKNYKSITKSLFLYHP